MRSSTRNASATTTTTTTAAAAAAAAKEAEESGQVNYQAASPVIYTTPSKTGPTAYTSGKNQC